MEVVNDFRAPLDLALSIYTILLFLSLLVNYLSHVKYHLQQISTIKAEQFSFLYIPENISPLNIFFLQVFFWWMEHIHFACSLAAWTPNRRSWHIYSIIMFFPFFPLSDSVYTKPWPKHLYAIMLASSLHASWLSFVK